jgi:hypothetical protein
LWVGIKQKWCPAPFIKIFLGRCFMKNTKKLLFTIVALTMVVSTYAQQYESESDFKYEWDKNVQNGVMVTKYLGKRSEVRIPPSIKNYRVTSIGSSAFSKNKAVTSVIIPSTVTTIDGGASGAFNGCTSLTNVTIPNSVTSIGKNAFIGCTGLKSITIPNSVTSIGNDAFRGCTELRNVTIPNNVTSIGNRAFSGCYSFTSVTIPRNVSTIGGYAFENCKNLVSVTFQSLIDKKEFGKGGQNKSGEAEGLFPGDLARKYLDEKDGGTGTYVRFADSQEWRKQ